MTAALSCRGLVKTFDRTRALDGVDLTVEPDTIFGLLGPNGSGKTTTIRTSLGIYRPDGGSIEILGSRNPLAVRRRTGYLPEERGLYPKMRVQEQLAFLASIRGLSDADSQRRAAAWLERLGLAARAQSLTRELSKGMQQKVQFAAAVIHDPALVVLDEPFSGLDPINSRLLKELMDQSMIAAVLPMVIALMVALSVIGNPSASMVRVLSLVPFFTPLVMMARVNVLMPPLWEIWLGILLLAVSTAAASWAASKIFTYALLMTGKRPTLPDLLQVIKAG